MRVVLSKQYDVGGKEQYDVGGKEQYDQDQGGYCRDAPVM
jgi:hypothetical protein